MSSQPEDALPPPKPSEAAKLASVAKLNFRSWLWSQHHSDTEFATLARLVLSGGPEGIWTNKPLKAAQVTFDIQQMYASGRSGITAEHVRLAEEARDAYRADDRSVEDMINARDADLKYAEKSISIGERDAVSESLGEIEPVTMRRNGFPVFGEGGVVRVKCDYVNGRGHHCPRTAVVGSTRCDHHGGTYLDPEEIKAILERGQEKIVSATDKALETVLDLMQNSVQDPIRLKAAEMILDRAGFRPGMEITIADGSSNGPARTPMEIVREKLDRLKPSEMVVDQSGKQIES